MSANNSNEIFPLESKPLSVLLSSYANSDKILPPQSIRETIIPTLIQDLDKAKRSLSDSQDDYQKKMAIQIEKLRKDLIYIRQAFTGLKSFEESASVLFKILLQPEHSLEKLLEFPTHVTTLGAQAKKLQEYKLAVLGEIIIKLKLLMPSPHKLLLNRDNPLLLAGIGREPHKLPDLHLSKVFSNSLAFKEFRVVYDTLADRTKLCLLCFAVFPANEVIKKRLLVHWWVGEGFLDPLDDEEKTVEEIAEEIFENLTMTGCIEPVNKKRRSDTQSVKMQPIIRSAVIIIAKEVGFFDFDDDGNPTSNFSLCYRACLMNLSSSLIKINSPDLDQEKVQTLFNVNESYLDISKLDWSKLRNVKVLYLGRWHSRAKHHIEVDDIECLKGMRFMKHLRFFSLRGISSIMKLPGSVCKLVSLTTLDLAACHNLEKLPKGIGLLKTLTHLDISECYLLDQMPKGIALLSELQVFKGFIVGVDRKDDHSSCTLRDLSSGLQKLLKLSISTSREDFPREEDELIDLQKFTRLQKLTIAWGWLDKRSKQDDAAAQPPTPTGCGTKFHVCKFHVRKLPLKRRITRSNAMIREHFKELEKLDLQCYPRMEAPSWLIPEKLRSLKKLYIRGGQLQKLGADQVQEDEADKWIVETLRLKFLTELKMDWEELTGSFPRLTYLEKFRCPKLTFFPCDQSGVWMASGNRAMEPEQG